MLHTRMRQGRGPGTPHSRSCAAATTRGSGRKPRSHATKHTAQHLAVSRHMSWAWLNQQLPPTYDMSDASNCRVLQLSCKTCCVEAWMRASTKMKRARHRKRVHPHDIRAVLEMLCMSCEATTPTKYVQTWIDTTRAQEECWPSADEETIFR